MLYDFLCRHSSFCLHYLNLIHKSMLFCGSVLFFAELWFAGWYAIVFSHYHYGYVWVVSKLALLVINSPFLLFSLWPPSFFSFFPSLYPSFLSLHWFGAQGNHMQFQESNQISCLQGEHLNPFTISLAPKYSYILMDRAHISVDYPYASQ